MNQRILLVSILCATSIACGSAGGASPSADDDAQFPAYSAGWPEEIISTTAWPRFGAGANGVLTAPAWSAPASFGCEQRRPVRTEPSSTSEAPGWAPRTVYGPVIETACLVVGATVSIVDDPAYAPIFRGSCASSITLAVRDVDLAAIRFESDAACKSFTTLRDDATGAGSARRIQSKLRLTATGPNFAMELVEAKSVDRSTSMGVPTEL